MSATAEGGSVGGAVGDAKPPARRTKAQKRKDQRYRRDIREYLARLFVVAKENACLSPEKHFIHVVF